MKLSELTFLSMKVLTELGVENVRHDTYLEVLRAFFEDLDFTGIGELVEDQVAVLLEAVIQYYRGKRPLPKKTGKKGGSKKGIKIPIRDLKENYDLDKKLGQGGQGTVYLGKERAT